MYNEYKHVPHFASMRKEGFASLKARLEENGYQSHGPVKLKQLGGVGPFSNIDFPVNPHGIAAINHALLENGGVEESTPPPQPNRSNSKGKGWKRSPHRRSAYSRSRSKAAADQQQQQRQTRPQQQHQQQRH